LFKLLNLLSQLRLFLLKLPQASIMAAAVLHVLLLLLQLDTSQGVLTARCHSSCCGSI
jgi:hypothetical protein